MLPAHWEDTKAQYVLSAGFALGDGQRLDIWHDYRFSSYTGKGATDFALKLSVEWKFEKATIVRCVTVDASPISQLDATIDYMDIAVTPVDTDRVVAEVIKTLLERIAQLSRA